MSYKILLVSSGQPSLNPRLVKEADTLTAFGYNVTVLYAYWNSWGTKLDKDLLQSKKWRAIRVGGSPLDESFIYLISRLLFKTAMLFTRLTGSMLLANMAISRTTCFLIRAAKKHQADIYIGHNLGALPAVVSAAKKYNKPCIFDAEDFHRNEVTDKASSIAVKLPAYIEDRYIPQLQYLTASSPLINAEYQRLYPQIKGDVLLNAFPKMVVTKKSISHATNPIKLFWFSQTVGLYRGLEQMIAALQQIKNHAFELNLLGDVHDDIRDLFISQISNTASSIHFHPPIPPDQIMEFAAQFDIGIAAENSTPLNRDICLTNKLFTYIQAGLPLLVSDTRAQTAFMQQYAVAGKLYSNNNLASLADALLHYYHNREELSIDKTYNYNLGQTTLNWDIEAHKLLNLVQQHLPA